MGNFQEYIGGIDWAPVYINAVDTGYKISNSGFLRKGDRLVDDQHIEFNNRSFRINRRYLLALNFVDNPREQECVTGGNKIAWYTNKELIKEAIDIELPYFNGSEQMEGTEKERVRHACELMQNPEFRLPYVSIITGINPTDLYLIRLGEKWNDISRDYLFPISNFEYGDKRYSYTQIHEVCEMLSNKKMLKQSLIQRMTGVNTYAIDLIRNRRGYQRISMFYEFCPKEITRKSELDSYSNQQIRHACCMLEDPKYSYELISDFCNMNINVLYKLRDRQVFEYISRDFDTETFRTDNGCDKRILFYINKGMPLPEIISRIQLDFKIYDRAIAKQMADNVRQKYFNVKRSTTIP